jgi:uncharacterized membrane protein
MSEENSWSQSQRIKNAMCYIPFVAVIFFFAENKKTAEFERHCKYWITLLVVFMVLTILIRWTFFGFIFLLYIWVSVFLWYKAYNWENVKIDSVDDSLSKVEDIMKKFKNDTPKKEETKEKKEEVEDVLK